VAPDAAEAQPMLYSITKDQDVISFLRGQSSTQRDIIQSVIDDLQSNPRPPGHKVINWCGTKIIKIMVNETQPKYGLHCIVNDEESKIFVLAVVDNRFSEMEVEHGKQRS
jgi:hypothetical protein